MTVNRVVSDDVEYFDSIKEITEEEDRVELDIHILGWSRKMRIRALSFAQMEKINKMATYTESKKSEGITAGELNHEEWVYWTIKEGVVRPAMTIAQARTLADNNGDFVRELADEIWNLGRISKRMWDAYILEQRKLSKLNESENPNADESVPDDSD